MRKEASEKAMAIVEEEAAKTDGWFQGLDIVPTVRVLRDKYRWIRKRKSTEWAAGQSRKCPASSGSPGPQPVEKFLHEPTTRLEGYWGTGDGEARELLRGILFALEDERERKTMAKGREAKLAAGKSQAATSQAAKPGAANRPARKKILGLGTRGARWP